MSRMLNAQRSHLVLVLDDVGVDLVQGRHAVELVGVQARLLGQVGTHVLVADGRHPGDVGVVPGGEGVARVKRGLGRQDRGGAVSGSTYLSTQFL